MQYSLQINSHGNRIVCKGTEVRNSYRIVFVGSYAACQQYGVIHCLSMAG